MSQYDPAAVTLDYAERAAETRRTVASSAWAAANGLQVGSIAPGQSDEVYLQIVEELPEAALDQAGRLLYQRRADANDLLYVGIIDDAGDPRWVLLSELVENAAEQALFKWSVQDNANDFLSAMASTGTELLTVESSGASTWFVRRRNLSTGASIGTFGSFGTGSGQFGASYGLAVSAAGNIHVADTQGSRVVQFNSSRSFVRNIGSIGSGNGNLNDPFGIATDASNNIYVGDAGNDRIAVFSSTGSFIRNFGGSGTGDGQFVAGPNGVAISSTGELFVADVLRHDVQVFDAATGTFLRKFGSYGAQLGQFINPQYLAIDADDNLYVADRGNNRIQKLTTTGQPLMAIVGSGTSAPIYPQGIAVVGADVYVNAKTASTGQVCATKRYTIVPDGGIEVASNGTTASSQAKLNFVAGTGVAVTVADDATNGEADITLDAFPMRVVFHNSVAQWLNMQSAETPMFAYREDDWATPVDLSRATEARVIVRSNSAVSGANIRIRYTNTGTGASMSFAALANSGNVSANLATTTTTTNTTIGSWTAIAPGAKINPCYIAPYGQGGDGAADPYILYVAVEFR